MKKVELYFCFLLLFPFFSYSQKSFKSIKSALKSKNYVEVISKVTSLEKDSCYMNSPKLCLYKIEALRGLNDIENMKLYLKEKYDTVSFFSTTYRIVQTAIKLDSLENELYIQKNKKIKNAGLVRNLLLTYFPNLHAASRFYYLRKDYFSAMRFLHTCITVPHMPVGIKAGLSFQHDISNASLYLLSAYRSKTYPEVHRYESLSLQDTLIRPTILECLVNTAEAENNYEKYLYWLHTAWAEYPLNKIFFTKLADYYAAHNDYDKVLELSRLQETNDTTNYVATLAKCMALFNLQRFDDCIQEGINLLEKDSTYVDANYYVGASFVAKGHAVHFPDIALSSLYQRSLEQQKKLYRQALPYLELYKERKPQSSKRWAPLLYKVYLVLNEGKKFADIEKFL